MFALAVIAGLVATLALLWWSLRGAARRPRGDALGPFLRHFEPLGVAPETARAAYHELAGWLMPPRVPAPGDDLARVYGVGPDERRESAALLARACGRALPDDANLDDVTRVEQLVLLVARGARPAERA